MAQLPPALNKAKELLQGKGLMAHPIHVAINHAPLGLWGGGVIFDLMSRRRQWSKLSEGGYYLNLLGIITAVPTILTGAAEFADIPPEHPGWKVAATHAALNDIALGLSVYNWWTRRNKRHHAPSQTNLIVDGVLVSVLGLSGYLGGVIAHEYGYGTHRQGSSIEKKNESLVGPQDDITRPKVLMTPEATMSDDTNATSSSSLDSWAGTAANEVADRDEAVEAQFADPGDSRERGGTGI